MTTCKQCSYVSEDSRYDRGRGKCLRRSYLASDRHMPVEHMVNLSDRACELYFATPSPDPSIQSSDKGGKNG